ncbi:PEPxxWA-CTERM sorting domain-containing protein [Phenylobacterium sp.]|uniref:PEPxxWA-CTERM sorting domain-containing protein n=1 Tax=Phenylobacterium sp. TaxID=1871053 RepID=UPI0025F71B32|nr:PEPxxWA-CTERM sorting domain-containing protein [Phenylobacterium sp.]
MGISISNNAGVSADFDNIVATPFGGAVPEPSTWALTIGGFGLAGATLRRRRAAIAG